MEKEKYNKTDIAKYEEHQMIKYINRKKRNIS